MPTPGGPTATFEIVGAGTLFDSALMQLNIGVLGFRKLDQGRNHKAILPGTIPDLGAWTDGRSREFQGRRPDLRTVLIAWVVGQMSNPPWLLPWSVAWQ
jgi:hypothetical protein